MGVSESSGTPEGRGSEARMAYRASIFSAVFIVGNTVYALLLDGKWEETGGTRPVDHNPEESKESPEVQRWSRGGSITSWVCSRW